MAGETHSAGSRGQGPGGWTLPTLILGNSLKSHQPQEQEVLLGRVVSVRVCMVSLTVHPILEETWTKRKGEESGAERKGFADRPGLYK